MNRTISFVKEDSKELIANHSQFEITQKSGILIQTLEGHTNSVNCIEQIEDFSKIITCSGDESIKIWSAKSGDCLKTLTGHTGFITSLTISSDKKLLISGSLDEAVKVWNIENDFECVQTLQQEDLIWSLCLLPNDILLCGLDNGIITKLSLNNFTEIDSFKAHRSYIWDIKHVPSSSQIVSCSGDKNIHLWNLDTNECVRSFTGHGDQVKCLEISFDRSKLYSGGLDKTFRVWDFAS